MVWGPAAGELVGGRGEARAGAAGAGRQPEGDVGGTSGATATAAAGAGAGAGAGASTEEVVGQGSASAAVQDLRARGIEVVSFEQVVEEGRALLSQQAEAAGGSSHASLSAGLVIGICGCCGGAGGRAAGRVSSESSGSASGGDPGGAAVEGTKKVVPQLQRPGPEDVATIMYTSGTTGGCGIHVRSCDTRVMWCLYECVGSV